MAETAEPNAKRLALFGGSFDPPHRGHISIARAAADRFQLQGVLFAPAGRQPLKSGVLPAPFADRLAMTRFACAADARFAASSIDAPHQDGSPNYTFEALEALRLEHPRARLYAIAGADSFLTLRQWSHPERLLQLAEWIVANRPGFRLEEIEALGLTPEQRARVHLLETVHEDISATELRRRLAEGESCAGWIPERVAAYIAEHGLYGVRKQGS